ncbi:copper resistance protein B [Pontibacterium granulatum]|uniref:copper resistance protein B n=1 Tax=Pontibacterium granulatum TaxID=2036029 RepID=UPI00249BE27F|nr:copper resistance protein B [Pontibacterium granulatum]MDI3323777.1 copper resistance protein B [Pontibacterium granulatum]
MKRITTSVLTLSLLLSPAAQAAMEDDPLLSMVTIDQLEKRDASGGNPVVWEIQGWLGYDLDKLVFKTEGERVTGETEDAELQLLYSRAVDPYWDFQIGVRHDFRPDPSQNWAVLGFQGLTPYFLETDASLFIGESGQSALRLETEYELMLTQKWVLAPELEVNLYAEDDEARGIGSGLSGLELGLRLRYEIRREFAPYIGLNWERKFGQTADFARDEGEDTNDLQAVIGIRAWF